MLVVAAQGASLGSAIVAIGLAMSAIVARLTRVLVKRVLAAGLRHRRAHLGNLAGRA